MFSARKLVAIAALGFAIAGCDAGQEPAGDAPMLAPVACAAGERLLDNACFRPGVPVDGCAPGFMHDGVDSCEPILPGSDCAEGEMAVPGETECREVAACGDGRFGSIPIDGSTQLVDASGTGPAGAW